ncbi:FAD-bindingdomain-containingprotein [Moniliophthora roreri MCA 2997]|uniref:FAD-bindingdomain-containingprotein n=1 Tax=Moniliophthora roreri (strain MCA 2997) TaxID=1381753 RepID=V2YHY1_MONRO|nr:FAD-bindingdomain-containingprotein [Moniliophthora roreri MCA 2997]
MLRYAVLAVFHASLWSSTWSHPTELNTRSLQYKVCLQIKREISSASDVYFAGDPLYVKGVEHWATSSSDVAECVVEPGTTADLGIILGILGETRTPFAVKGGGHASNPGFSSTTGVQIAMSRFSEVTYNAQSQTAVIGAGLIWDDVYAALAPYNVNVVGGRVTGVGVAGFTLGGGYSWLTNQHGLTIDTVVAFELVQTDGTAITVTETSDPDLFLSLKGGLNNFGIVTRFTLKTFPQGQVWGGVILFSSVVLDDVNAACEQFASTVSDPKASIITTYNFASGDISVLQILFYDGPYPPAGIFDDFLAIPFLTKDVETRDFLSLVQSSPANATAGQRGIFDTVPLLEVTPTILDAIVNETRYWGSRLSSLDSGTLASYAVEPFLPSILSHTTLASAYPPTRTTAFLPLNLYYAWLLPSFDNDSQDAARESVRYLTEVALAEGQTGVDTAALYPNYAIYDVPVSRLYGSNVATMQAVKARVDPSNVMGLAGGFKI